MSPCSDLKGQAVDESDLYLNPYAYTALHDAFS
jgi:hypothetical protein